MRYIPDIIPEDKKLLKEYFSNQRHSESQNNSLRTIASYVIGTLAFLFALACIQHPFLSLLFVGFGLVTFPLCRPWVEKLLRLRLELRVNLALTSILTLIIIPLHFHYKHVDQEQLLLEQARIARQKLEQEALAKKEEFRKDTLRVLLTSSKQSLTGKQYKDADALLDKAQAFCKESADYSQVAEIRAQVAMAKGIASVSAGKYRDALPLLDQAFTGTSNSELFYYRGLCHAKLGNKKLAVDDLRNAVDQGHQKAKTLFERINPLKKRLLYYVTRCCDGTTSSAKGRGACSHHDGVCNWNDPIYETYRDY